MGIGPILEPDCRERECDAGGRLPGANLGSFGSGLHCMTSDFASCREKRELCMDSGQVCVPL